MATTTFAVAKVDVCTKQHAETNDLSKYDVARWAEKDKKLSVENFQINYPLVDDLKRGSMNSPPKLVAEKHLILK